MLRSGIDGHHGRSGVSEGAAAGCRSRFRGLAGRDGGYKSLCVYGPYGVFAECESESGPVGSHRNDPRREIKTVILLVKHWNHLYNVVCISAQVAASLFVPCYILVTVPNKAANVRPQLMPTCIENDRCPLSLDSCTINSGKRSAKGLLTPEERCRSTFPLPLAGMQPLPDTRCWAESVLLGVAGSC